MDSRGRKPVKTAIAVLSALTVTVLAFVLVGVLSEDLGGRWPWSIGSAIRSPLAVTVTFEEKFTRCGDSTSRMVETTKSELAEMLSGLPSGWKVVQMGDASAVVQRETEAFCPEHEDFRFIALYRGGPADRPHVCVFRGKKVDPAFITKDCRNLTEDSLYPQDRTRLRAGVLVQREPTDPPDIDLDEKAALYLSGIAEGR